MMAATGSIKGIPIVSILFTLPGFLDVPPPGETTPDAL